MTSIRPCRECRYRIQQRLWNIGWTYFPKGYIAECCALAEGREAVWKEHPTYRDEDTGEFEGWVIYGILCNEERKGKNLKEWIFGSKRCGPEGRFFKKGFDRE